MTELMSPDNTLLKRFAGCLIGHVLALFTAVWALALYLAVREGVVHWGLRNRVGGGHADIFFSTDPVGYWLAMAMLVLGLWISGKITRDCYRHCLRGNHRAGRTQRRRQKPGTQEDSTQEDSR